MKCKQVQKNIADFLNDNLEPEELRAFVEHIEGCEECKEELTIELLVKEGLNSLESGTIFDIEKAYSYKIGQAEKNIKNTDLLTHFYHMMIGLVVVGVVAVGLLLILM